MATVMFQVCNNVTPEIFNFIFKQNYAIQIVESQQFWKMPRFYFTWW